MSVSVNFVTKDQFTTITLFVFSISDFNRNPIRKSIAIFTPTTFDNLCALSPCATPIKESRYTDYYPNHGAVCNQLFINSPVQGLPAGCVAVPQ